MKKIFLAGFLLAATCITVFAQDNLKTDPFELLASYYNIKDALVGSKAAIASTKAQEFVKALNTVDSKIVDDASRNALLKDAGSIAESKDIKHQREHFASFTANMYTLVKSVKLTSHPVYYAYCPMKKAHWLSSDAGIKNPYYGSSMLTCGKVEETLK